MDPSAIGRLVQVTADLDAVTVATGATVLAREPPGQAIMQERDLSIYDQAFGLVTSSDGLELAGVPQ